MSKLKPLEVLDLFSGIGGFAIASHLVGFKTTQFVEKAAFPRSILRKHFPDIPIHDDITTFTADRGSFDIITAGFPCQDLSVANANGRGLDGERSGLFFEVVRLIRTIRPRFVVLENVSALLARGLDRVLWEIAESGYDAEWQIVSAASLGAPHRRERLFIVAYPNSCTDRATQTRSPQKTSGIPQIDIEGLEREKPAQYPRLSTSSGQTTSHPQSKRSPRHCGNQGGANQASERGSTFWQQNEAPEPTVCRMDDGVPKGLDSRRLKALGNAVTPQQALVPLLRVKRLIAQQAIAKAEAA